MKLKSEISSRTVRAKKAIDGYQKFLNNADNPIIGSELDSSPAHNHFRVISQINCENNNSNRTVNCNCRLSTNDPGNEPGDKGNEWEQDNDVPQLKNVIILPK